MTGVASVGPGITAAPMARNLVAARLLLADQLSGRTDAQKGDQA